MGNSISDTIAAKSLEIPIPKEALEAIGTELKYPHIKNISILRGLMALLTSTISLSILVIWMIVRSHKGLSLQHHIIYFLDCVSLTYFLH